MAKAFHADGRDAPHLLTRCPVLLPGLRLRTGMQRLVTCEHRFRSPTIDIFKEKDSFSEATDQD